MFGGSRPGNSEPRPTEHHHPPQPHHQADGLDVAAGWTVKNLIELKNAETVAHRREHIENNWAAGQQGYSILS